LSTSGSPSPAQLTQLTQLTQPTPLPKPQVTHNTGYNVFIRGALIEPGDQIAFVRKDKALDGTDSDTSTGLVDANDAQNCAQANAGTIPLSSIGVDHSVNDYGGQVRRECKTTANGCNPSTCVVYPESDALYHDDCRYASEFNMVGVQDTIHPDRHPHDKPLAIGAPPAAPPWFDSLTDTHYDNGGTNNQLVAGSGQTDETYDESGTYYMCYRQDRDPGIPGYQTFTFLK